MPKLIRNSLLIGIVFLAVELGFRWAVRDMVTPGSTVHLLSNIYLTNVTNVNSTMAFGLGAVAWMSIAIVICILWVLGFGSLQFIPLTKNDGFAKVGCLASFLVLSVAVANIFEAILLGGVTDYVAFVDIANGRAKVINAGDLALTLGLAGIAISAIGLAASLVARASRAAG